ncbi:MAG: hypothetical protein M1818_001664 [Claussenomyces sp. TS43310]|nr:MAG: hypothetical protein M1818_001664 [Claussenomyces sp. TS43310]
MSGKGYEMRSLSQALYPPGCVFWSFEQRAENGFESERRMDVGPYHIGRRGNKAYRAQRQRLLRLRLHLSCTVVVDPEIIQNVADVQPHLAVDDATVRFVIHNQLGRVVPRYVTDCERTSGRVYDRYRGEEVPRLIATWEGKVWDRLTGVMRRRSLMDDLRDRRADRALEITEEEQQEEGSYSLFICFDMNA